MPSQRGLHPLRPSTTGASEAFEDRCGLRRALQQLSSETVSLRLGIRVRAMRGDIGVHWPDVHRVTLYRWPNLRARVLTRHREAQSSMVSVSLSGPRIRLVRAKRPAMEIERA